MGFIFPDSFSLFFAEFFISNSKTTQKDNTNTSYGERETKNGGAAKGERKTRTRKRDPEMGIWIPVYSGNPPDNWGNVRKYNGSKRIESPDIRLEYSLLYRPFFLGRHATLPQR